MDPIPRMGHPVIRDCHLDFPSLRIYQADRLLRIADPDDSIHLIYGDRPAPFFPLYPLFLWWRDPQPHLDPASYPKSLLCILINIRNYPTAPEVL
jgi:hypothetical protein